MKNVFKNAKEWNRTVANETGLPRPFFKTPQYKIKLLNLAKIVPIPWQSIPQKHDFRLLELDYKKESLVFENNLCAYCGLTINNNEIVIRWKTISLAKLVRNKGEGLLVFSDIHPFHIECMNQARTFCPFMKKLKDNDFEQGLFLKLKENANKQKKIAERIINDKNIKFI